MNMNITKIPFDFDYSKEDDILTIFDYSKPVKETIEFSEFLNVSVGADGEIVGFEIFDAGQFLGALNPSLNKEFLQKLTKVELEQKEYRNNFFVIIWLHSQKQVVSQPLPLLNKTTYESPLIASIH